MKNIFDEKIKNNPVIAAVKSIENLQSALDSDCNVIFLLCGSISTLKSTIEAVKNKGKMIFVHVDLIDGLGRDAAAIKYLHNEFSPNGIISTKNLLLKAAAKEGMLTIQRFFILDSISLLQCLRQSAESKPTAIEIMPGIMPEIINEISKQIPVPVIVGGLIKSKAEIDNALKNGAHGVSVSKSELW